MRLCDRDIRIWLNNNKLIITPKPDIQSIHGVTVDICLGNKFRIFNEYSAPFIDLSGSKNQINNIINKVISKEIIINDDNFFFLQPGDFVLAITLECITLPNNLIGWLDGRSSLARLGLLVHATAHRIDPGWHGHIVLEFFNAGKLPLALKPGISIGALSFELLKMPVEISYKNRVDAKYFGQDNTTINPIKK